MNGISAIGVERRDRSIRSAAAVSILTRESIITLRWLLQWLARLVLLAGSMEIALLAGYAHADQVKKDLIHSDAGSGS